MFEDLFVFELANNHLGDFNKAKTLIDECYKVLVKTGFASRAAIKFQLRDTKTFVHKDFRQRDDIRYVRKVLDTALCDSEYEKLYDYAKKLGFLTAAAPFDEYAINLCAEFNLDIIKIASSDIKNLTLLKGIAELKKPVIASFGGYEIEECDRLVSFFKSKDIPFALNHCVCLYPAADEELNLERISFLKNRYRDLTIGFSTHQTEENLALGVFGAYMQGARMIERHIDIAENMRPYCSLPEKMTEVINSYFLAKAMYGGNCAANEAIKEREKFVLSKFTRGVFASKDLFEGDILEQGDFYFACPMIADRQLSHNYRINGLKLRRSVKKDEAIMLDYVYS